TYVDVLHPKLIELAPIAIEVFLGDFKRNVVHKAGRRRPAEALIHWHVALRHVRKVEKGQALIAPDIEEEVLTAVRSRHVQRLDERDAKQSFIKIDGPRHVG